MPTSDTGQEATPPTIQPLEGYNAISNKTSICSLSLFEDAKDNNTEVEDYSALFAVIIAVKSGTKSDPLTYYNRIGAKRQQVNSTYYRMLTFASIGDTDGKTAVILEKQEEDARRLWRYDLNRTNVTIGTKVLIYEPQVVGYLPSNQIIISTDLPLVCLAKPNLPLRYHDPAQFENTHRYFILPNCAIRATAITMQDSKCSGTFCDRQKVLSHNEHCGCYSKHDVRNDDSNSAVLQTTIKVKHASLLEDIIVKEFRSYRFTLLQFQKQMLPRISFKYFIDHDVLTLLRKTVNSNIEKGNENGGWTVIGWYYRGTKQDKSTQESTLAEQVTYHVVYMQPTTMKPNDLTTLTALQLRTTGGTTSETTGNPNNNH